MKPSRLVMCSVVLMAALAPARPASGERPAPFGTVDAAALYLTDINNSPFHVLWSPRDGVALDLETPFYLGRLRLGIHYFKNSSRQPDVPGFGSTFVYLGWGVEWRAWTGLRWFNGVHAGNFHMDFEDTDSVDELRTESELGLGAYSRFRYTIGSVWSAQLGVEYRAIFTKKKIEYAFVTVGIGRSFAAPKWLKEFLE